MSFSLRSPSLQVSVETLQQAHKDGVASYFRPAQQGPEVVIAVHPDMLLWYVQDGQGLHNADNDSRYIPELNQPTPEDERAFIDDATSEDQAARRHELVEIMRAYRDAKFRPNVLRAYSYRCAVCGCALKLVDAAHIIPVSHPQATDEVTNGLALCRIHHGAYDNGLLGVRSDFKIILNTDAVKRLTEVKLQFGLENFRKNLPEMITLPNVYDVRPKPKNLRIGLEARCWPKSLVC
jgi:putative restriction endonuclease